MLPSACSAALSTDKSARQSSLPGIDENEPLSPEVTSQLSHSFLLSPSRSPSTFVGASSASTDSPGQTSMSDATGSQQVSRVPTPRETPLSGDLRSASDTLPGRAPPSNGRSPGASQPLEGTPGASIGAGKISASISPSSDVPEPSLRPGQHARLSQNVRMSRGWYGDLHSMDGSLWDTPASSSSGNQSSAQLSGHRAPVVPSPGSAMSSGDQQGQVSMERPRRPHSTSSSDEWLQKQAGSSSTSRNSSHHSSSSKSNPESLEDSHECNESMVSGDSNPSSQAASFAKAESVAMDRPTGGAEHDEQATGDVSPQCSSKPASSEAQSAGSVGMASLSAGVAPQMPSLSQASTAASQADESDHDDSVLSSVGQQGSGTTPVQTADGSTQSIDSYQVAAGAFLPRSASMDVEVGSLGGDWAQDAQTLGLSTPATHPASAETATQLASPSALAAPGAAAEGSAASLRQPDAEQKTHGVNTGASPSFGLELQARPVDSTDTPPTPQFQIPGRMAGSPQEQATPQMTMMGRAEHAPTAVPPQLLASHPSLESDAATPSPRVLPQPIQVAEAVTSKVQIPVGRLHADGPPQKPPHALPSAAPAEKTAGNAQAPAVSHAGDLMSPPTVCTPVMPRGHQFDKPRAASKRAADQVADQSLALEMAQHQANGRPAIGQLAAGNAPKAPSVFLTTPPPPTAPKVSSRTRKRSPRSSSSVADQPGGSLTAPQSLIGQIQGRPDSHLITLDAGAAAGVSNQQQNNKCEAVQSS